jgi:beta-glucosidase
VVQLYVRDVESVVDRPLHELKGFEKISLAPGETKTVSFTLDKRSFAYFDVSVHTWIVESGIFEVELGSSSRDIRLKGAVTVGGTEKIPVVFTMYSTMEDILATEKGRSVLTPILEQMRQGRQGGAGLGEGSTEMENTMMMGLPLSALVHFGGINVEQIAALIAALNS